jgi:hypothetical protein
MWGVDRGAGSKGKGRGYVRVDRDKIVIGGMGDHKGILNFVKHLPF